MFNYMHPGNIMPSARNFVTSPDSVEKIIHLAERYHNDSDFRGRIDDGGSAEILMEFGGVDMQQDDIDFVLVADSDDVCHFVVAPDPNSALSDEELSELSGGSSASTAGSLGSASSAVTSTSASSISTFATAACAGSAG